MPETLTFVGLLGELGGVELLHRRCDATLEVALLALPKGRQLLALERTYREGICVILDPTPEEIETAKTGSLWDLWNSERATRLHSLL